MKKSDRDMFLKVKRIGGSLTVIIPKDIANLYGISEGSSLEVVPASKEELTLVYKKQRN